MKTWTRHETAARGDGAGADAGVGAGAVAHAGSAAEAAGGGAVRKGAPSASIGSAGAGGIAAGSGAGFVTCALAGRCVRFGAAAVVCRGRAAPLLGAHVRESDGRAPTGAAAAPTSCSWDEPVASVHVGNDERSDSGAADAGRPLLLRCVDCRDGADMMALAVRCCGAPPRGSAEPPCPGPRPTLCDAMLRR